MKSYCKTDLTKMSCGAALDIKIFPDSLTGDNGISALIALMDGFLALSGFFMQLDAVDTQTLLEAQKDPQKFKTLSVRVSGWNARFVTLNREWQNMIIERNAAKLELKESFFYAPRDENSAFLHQGRPGYSHDRIFERLSFTMHMVS